MQLSDLEFFENETYVVRYNPCLNLVQLSDLEFFADETYFVKYNPCLAKATGLAAYQENIFHKHASCDCAYLCSLQNIYISIYLSLKYERSVIDIRQLLSCCRIPLMSNTLNMGHNLFRVNNKILIGWKIMKECSSLLLYLCCPIC